MMEEDACEWFHPEQGAVNFNVFGAFVEDQVFSNVKRRLTIAVKTNWVKMRDMKRSENVFNRL